MRLNIENFVSRELGDIRDTTLRIAKTKSQSMFDVPGNILGATLEEGIKYPIRKALGLSSWTLRKMFSLLGDTVGFGFNLLYLVPIPLPGRTFNIAEGRGFFRRFGRALAEKENGSSERFADICTRLKGTRTYAQAAATHETIAA